MKSSHIRIRSPVYQNTGKISRFSDFHGQFRTGSEGPLSFETKYKKFQEKYDKVKKEVEDYELRSKAIEEYRVKYGNFVNMRN
jgi:hypothetical protein